MLGLLRRWWAPRPPLQRSAVAQQQVAAHCAALTLYSMTGCPYCTRVQRTIRHLNLPIESLDIRRDPGARRRLRQLGGLDQVPCLHIHGEAERWLYESAAINTYLKGRFTER